YQEKAKRFLLKLLVLIHIFGGQPARGPELCGILIESSNGRVQNIFNDGGRICVVTTYHKSQNILLTEKLVLRYLHFRVGRL
ncbi:hypothetical protein BJ508DRAFT_187684, partial [Ascobolus immersus RN42]